MNRINVACTTGFTAPISSFLDFQGDLKELSQEDYLKLKTEILDTGFAFAPHVWIHDEKMYLVDGHQRVHTLCQMVQEGHGCPEIPYVAVEARDLAEAKRRVLQGTSQYGKMTGEGLYEFMTDAGLGVDNVEQSFRFPEIEMSSFREEFFDEPESSEGGGDAESVPDVPQVPKTRPGDLWILGTHRLLVGDCCDVKAVARLMNGQPAELVFTDPPYGVNYRGDDATRREDGKTIQNDDLDSVELLKFLTRAFQFLPLREGGGFYICSPAGDKETVFRLALQAAGHQLRQCLVWVKQNFVMGRQDYHWRHESILYGWREGAAHYFVDDRTQDTVWEFDRPRKSEEHPTMKPVDLIEKGLKNSSEKGGIVFDGFAGSGSTLIACERTDRQCRALEIDCVYADVILSRWAAFAGRDPVREDGQKWSELTTPAGVA